MTNHECQRWESRQRERYQNNHMFINELRLLRECGFDFESQHQSESEKIKLAEKLFRENGTIPHYSQLKRNGYGRLAEFISKYPEKISHLKQDKRVKSIEEWISIAENLPKNNKGEIPSNSILRKGKYLGLLRFMSKYPDKFSHIKQERLRRSMQDAFLAATKLTNQNNGRLPSLHWLNKNGFDWLKSQIKECPSNFKQFNQESGPGSGGHNIK
jgi:hypothetical protein